MFNQLRYVVSMDFNNFNSMYKWSKNTYMWTFCRALEILSCMKICSNDQIVVRSIKKDWWTSIRFRNYFRRRKNGDHQVLLVWLMISFWAYLINGSENLIKLPQINHVFSFYSDSNPPKENVSNYIHWLLIFEW